MAGKVKRLFYKLILTTVFVLLAVLTAVGSNRLTALSLDQQVRCGLPEHVHTKQCYLDDVLLCKLKAHNHTENCYLVLLQDNDINGLLQTIDTVGQKSLEGVLDSAMVQALHLNDAFADSVPPLTLSAQDISALNETITDHEIEPTVVLNENLRADTTLNYTPSVLAVGDSPATGTRAVNFYIMLDDRITLVGNGNLTNSNPDYYSYANTVAEYTSVLTTGLTTGNISGTYYFRYNTDGAVSSFSDFDTNATYQSSRVRFGNTSSARYVILCTRSGSTWNPTYSAVAFYTLTLDYSQSGISRTNAVEYVQSGMAPTTTLSDEFLWYDEVGNQVTRLPDSMTQTTTLYARPKAYTVTFEDADGNTLAPPYTATPSSGVLQVNLPNLIGTHCYGWYWIEKGSDGTSYYRSDGTATTYVTGSTTFVAIPNTYTVTFVDDTGQSTTQTVPYRDTVTLPSLPEGWRWYDTSGTAYEVGAASPPVTADMTFTAAERIINVYYDVNFPSGAVNAVDSVPTIYGTVSATATDRALGGRPLTILDLTSRTARREISSSNKESVRRGTTPGRLGGRRPAYQCHLLRPIRLGGGGYQRRHYQSARGKLHPRGV